METTFYEVVFEGNYHTIHGLLEGFQMGAGKEWRYYFSRNVHVKRETLGEAIKEWISLGSRLHHVIIEEEFLSVFKAALEERKETFYIGSKYIKSEKKIKRGRFHFSFKAYAPRFGNEIKTMMNNLPDGIELHDYDPQERIDKDAHGTELYSPEHEYVFEGGGNISGCFPELIEVWKLLEDYSLVEADSIEIEWAK